MASFFFDVRSYKLHFGLDLLQSSFEISMEALYERIRSAEAKLAHYMENGGIVERDAEGNVIFDEVIVHEFELEEATECANTFRKSFMMSIYHQWERYARSVVGSNEFTHPKLIAKLDAKGIVTDPSITEIHCLVNVIKHNSRAWAEKLFDKNPNLFSTLFAKLPDKEIDWYEALILTDNDVMRLIGIIRNSVPLPTAG
ncbi:hypothetical protein [Phyllobacterium sp. 22552]|uniref:hypothetical protein n=1 Tax=Phyllobacterium sp. 22552 TaxID=3453941 RepID=UPI003F863AAF